MLTIITPNVSNVSVLYRVSQHLTEACYDKLGYFKHSIHSHIDLAYYFYKLKNVYIIVPHFPFITFLWAASKQVRYFLISSISFKKFH